MRIRIIALLLPMLALTVSAQAQTPLEWLRKVQSGKPITITTLAGEKVEGRAGEVWTQNITVFTKTGRRVVKVDEIQTVQQYDPSWTGAAIGGSIGFLLALPAFDDQFVSEAAPLLAAFSASACALIGWGLDVLVQRKTTIYTAQAAPRASLVVGKRMVGVSIKF